MTKYNVYLTTGASYAFQVEAEDEDEAEQKAWEYGPPQLCYQCAEIDLGDWETEGIYVDGS